ELESLQRYEQDQSWPTGNTALQAILAAVSIPDPAGIELPEKIERVRARMGSRPELRELESFLLRSAGVAAEPRPEAFAKELAQRLRSEPDASWTSLLAPSLSSVHGLEPDATRQLRRLAAGETAELALIGWQAPKRFLRSEER